MDAKEITRAAVSGFVRQGATATMAETIAQRMIQEQPEEWARIIDRCERGEVSRLYVFVTRFGEWRFTTFTYAPGDADNSADIARLLGTRPAHGWVGAPETEVPELRNAYQVSTFDIAAEVCNAIKRVQ